MQVARFKLSSGYQNTFEQDQNKYDNNNKNISNIAIEQKIIQIIKEKSKSSKNLQKGVHQISIINNLPKDITANEIQKAFDQLLESCVIYTTISDKWFTLS